MTINFVKRRARRRAVSFDDLNPATDAEARSLGPTEADKSAFVSPHTPRTEANLGELQSALSEALDQLTADHLAVVTMF
jgi:DNA-directed RNA polymerase specialized sigma24 family protein